MTLEKEKKEITEMLVEKERTNSLVTLRSEALSDSEKEGIEKLFVMMLSLKQQINLRRLFENCGQAIDRSEE